MLLGFKPDELFNVRVVQGGKLDKADENGLSGYGIIGNAAFDAELLDEVGDRPSPTFARRMPSADGSSTMRRVA